MSLIVEKNMGPSTPAFLNSNLSITMVQYDFEQYALEHGIPETLDPLPYRKAGSVFATGEEAEPVMTSAKHDPRLRTVVCRHWLRDLCMKGKACEFLHQYDLSKMPLCRHGDRCKVKDCPFRHISEAERLECVFYSQGFCIHGPFCRYKHLRRERADLPAVADFTLGLSQMQAGKDGVQQRRPAPKPNEFFKVSLCKHFTQGECPFGEGCHFAHGEHELKKFPRAKDAGGSVGDAGDVTELSDNMFGNTEIMTVNYFQGGSSGGGKPNPILEPELASFFMVLAATQRDLAMSTVRSEWWIQRKHVEKVNTAYTNHNQVMFFFTASDSNHIQGAALMTSLATLEEEQHHQEGDNIIDEDIFCYKFQCEWYRTTELHIKTVLDAVSDLSLPSKTTGYCQDVSTNTGEIIIKALWNSPLVTLYESFSGNTEPPTDDMLLLDFRAPDVELSWPTMPSPGFIFGCTSQTMDECLGRGIMGLPAHMKRAAECICPGATIFLYNITDKLLFGIFEALTKPTMNILSNAFSKNSKALTSPFPLQIRFRVSLECPPLQDTDPIFNDIVRGRGSRIGPLTHAQAAAVASLMAQQCGALQYMMEYRRAVEEGRGGMVQPPPIALPPRIIGNTAVPPPALVPIIVPSNVPSGLVPMVIRST